MILYMIITDIIDNVANQSYSDHVYPINHVTMTFPQISTLSIMYHSTMLTTIFPTELPPWWCFGLLW